MATTEFRFDPGQILVPAFPGPLNRLSPVALGNNLTLVKGQAVARKTADSKFYPLNTGASDGTQIFGGFIDRSCASDGSGNVYFTFGGTVGGINYYAPPSSYADVYTGGIFDPNDVITAAAPVAEVDTFTPGGTITTGDVNTLTMTTGGGATTAVSFTVGGTTTAAAVAAGLIAAWNANATLAAYATASGTTTVVLTSAIPGNIMNVASSVTGVGTLTKAVTTAATGRAIADIIAGCPGARVLQPTGFWELP